ncbi:hypothetical protein NQ317_018734 [Molorchus minor]|uniref:Uncharacterized protein n=1 Tax=Molorchus minor TaxID=1323400 RepID=A0ABQ9IQA5_9CUCU|nr:hypothetical protein NQ317_018734 [Molorchus minor]
MQDQLNITRNLAVRAYFNHDSYALSLKKYHICFNKCRQLAIFELGYLTPVGTATRTLLINHEIFPSAALAWNRSVYLRRFCFEKFSHTHRNTTKTPFFEKFSQTLQVLNPPPAKEVTFMIFTERPHKRKAVDRPSASKKEIQRNYFSVQAHKKIPGVVAVS